MKLYKLLTLVLLISPALNATDVNFEKKFTQGAQNIYLINSSEHSKSQLKSYGYSVCGKKSFCLIWFFDNSMKANAGVVTMKSGNTWDPIPGLIGIYSKNKKINDLICYDKKGNC